jgi:hypothetical protein
MKTNLLLILILFVGMMASCTKEMTCENKVSENGISTVATSVDGSASVRNIVNDDMSSWNIRMNDIAANARSNDIANFPNHSMIIKEKHDANGNIIGYEVMYRDPSDENAVDGWIYLGLAPDGTIIYNANLKGASCQSCHKSGGSNLNAM